MRTSQAKQALVDHSVHDWYRFVLAYPDHFVRDMCERFKIRKGDVVLDPFCGTGTTVVECKKLGIDSIGVESNPACVFASTVKTDWSVEPAQLLRVTSRILESLRPEFDRLLFATKPLFSSHDQMNLQASSLIHQSSVAKYLIDSGMIERKWISPLPLYKSIALRESIITKAPATYRDVLLLALVSLLVSDIANIKFGPELYCVKAKDDVDVVTLFESKIAKIVNDLKAVQKIRSPGDTRVIFGDSRDIDQVLRQQGIAQVDHVITSPPYPTEKDYTRNTRLELAYLGFVRDKKSLRNIKDKMVRSHSKGIYASDCDGTLVADIPEVKALADEMRRRIVGKTYGFAKLYPRIIEEYFGGMHRHFLSLSSVLRPGGKCAYVVGEQRTYLGTYTPTAKILGILAERPEIGLVVEDILTWRSRIGTTGDGQAIKEEVLILSKPTVSKLSERPTGDFSSKVEAPGVTYARTSRRRSSHRSRKRDR